MQSEESLATGVVDPLKRRLGTAEQIDRVPGALEFALEQSQPFQNAGLRATFTLAPAGHTGVHQAQRLFEVLPGQPRIALLHVPAFKVREAQLIGRTGHRHRVTGLQRRGEAELGRLDPLGVAPGTEAESPDGLTQPPRLRMKPRLGGQTHRGEDTRLASSQLTQSFGLSALVGCRVRREGVHGTVEPAHRQRLLTPLCDPQEVMGDPPPHRLAFTFRLVALRDGRRVVVDEDVHPVRVESLALDQTARNQGAQRGARLRRLPVRYEREHGVQLEILTHQHPQAAIELRRPHGHAPVGQFEGFRQGIRIVHVEQLLSCGAVGEPGTDVLHNAGDGRLQMSGDQPQRQRQTAQVPDNRYELGRILGGTAHLDQQLQSVLVPQRRNRERKELQEGRQVVRCLLPRHEDHAVRLVGQQVTHLTGRRDILQQEDR
ncbi:hypothetical protein CA983_03135 [Streptomyces swartbergensis]|uniref:Uncharacterized protein n=1 Tax=Streptomyces swartbergensis TaxID=487165 RepID=A0A243SAD2_9ACTN|nr:hypothetical protein CA983_03135 [Streptomyces swartbergensis]